MKHIKMMEEDGFGIITIDVEDKSVNTLTEEVMNEIEQALDDFLIWNTVTEGVIFRSGKGVGKGFVVGADVGEIKNITSMAEAVMMITDGQRVFQLIEQYSLPTIALIEGNCLGGGLELAMACDYRVALDDSKTKLGLPEVQLGLHPGFGGTVRLPRLVGDIQALTMMLTGKPVSAKAAKRMGLVDDAVPKRYLMKAVKSVVKKPMREAGFMLRLPSKPLLRDLTTKFMVNQVSKKVNMDHYPAAQAIIDVWKAGDYGKEAVSFARLLLADDEVAHNLIRVFEISEAMKHTGRVYTHSIHHVHVIGAGVMGGDIAAWCALKGYKVTLQDRNEKVIASAVKRAHKLFKRKLKKPLLVQNAMDNLVPDVPGHGIHIADLIVEAVVENLTIKQTIFAHAESKAKDTCILATNTSSIPLEDIAESLDEPSRLVGLHFFNPVPLMPLVEIVRGVESDEESLNRLKAFTVAIGKFPLDVKSSPGFLVNRVLMPYLMEAVKLHEEGYSIEAIDKAALDFGMPMGPITLADTVGLDICKAVAEELGEPLGMVVPKVLTDLVDTGKLGKKTGSGFYQYKNGKPVKNKSDVGNPSAQQMIRDRLIGKMEVEALACLDEGVVSSADMLDGGMIFGTGFAPFRGGLMHYIKSKL